jgi:hypothetical protein
MQRTSVINADNPCNSVHIIIPTNIMKIIKSRRMKWAGHIACMGRDKK